MTRKDYRAIADAIARADADANTTREKELINLVIRELGIELRKDNERFRPDRFREACYVNRDEE